MKDNSGSNVGLTKCALIGDTERRMSRHVRIMIAAALAACAIALHLFFTVQAPLGGGDEPYYVQAGYDYAQDIRSGHPGRILSSHFIAEHPAFTKLLIAGAILADWQVRGYRPLSVQEENHTWSVDFHQSATFQQYTRDARAISSLCGVLLIVSIALVSPVAAIFALLSTVVLTYTTQVTLDAPGILFSTLALLVYCYGKSGRNPLRELLLAGLGIGLAIAAKYYYVVPGLVIMADWLITRRTNQRLALKASGSYCIAIIVSFGIVDLPFWTQGLPKLIGVLQMNGLKYASGGIAPSGFHAHWYAPLTNLTVGFQGWYSGGHNPFLIAIDPLIMVLALIGMFSLGLRYSTLRLWLIVSVAVLLLNPVKFPQYTSLAIVPLCFSAAIGATWIRRSLVKGPRPHNVPRVEPRIG